MENKVNNGTLYKLNNFNGDIIHKVNDYIIFVHSSKEAFLLSYDSKNNELNILKNSKVLFEDNITSISNSIITNKIYVCISYEKQIKIFDYNLKEESLKLSDEKIIINENIGKGYFNRCIPLSYNSLAVADDISVYILSKNNNNSKNYTLIYTININSKVFNLLLINEKYLIYLIIEGLRFFNISNFTLGKIISKIDPSNSYDSLQIINDYIIVNCIGGIAIISIESKELVQYIQNSIDVKNRILCKINEDSICLLIINYYFNITAIKLEFFEGEFIQTEEIIANDIKDFQPNNKGVQFYYINKWKILINGYYLYSLDQKPIKK